MAGKKSDWYGVEIHFKNGTHASFEALEFDLDLSKVGPGMGPEAQPHRLSKFMYKGTSGEEVALYLTLNEVAGITVSEH